MNDDQMDELLAKGTRDYNEPGPVPRDAMWARIEAARRVHSERGGGSPAPKRWGWAVGGLAAAILLAVGIVIGRRLERASPVQAPPVAQTPVTTTPRDSVVGGLRRETRDTDARVRRLAENPGPAATDNSNLAYRLVMLRHLAGSEAMITAFRSAARRGEVDAQIGEWSRELLGTTRMLEASPVTQDPTMKRLLDDLDLVIVQIAQYTTNGKHNPDDLDLIEQSINKRGVITKLRSSLPGRTLPAGT